MRKCSCGVTDKRTKTKINKMVCPEPPETGSGIVYVTTVVPEKGNLVTSGNRSSPAQCTAKEVPIKPKAPCRRRQKTGDLFMKGFHENNFYRDGEV